MLKYAACLLFESHVTKRNSRFWWIQRRKDSSCNTCFIQLEQSPSCWLSYDCKYYYRRHLSLLHDALHEKKVPLTANVFIHLLPSLYCIQDPFFSPPILSANCFCMCFLPPVAKIRNFEVFRFLLKCSLFEQKNDFDFFSQCQGTKRTLCFRLYPILIGVIVGIVLCLIFTATNVFPPGDASRTDSERTKVNVVISF